MEVTASGANIGIKDIEKRKIDLRIEIKKIWFIFLVLIWIIVGLACNQPVSTRLGNTPSSQLIATQTPTIPVNSSFPPTGTPTLVTPVAPSQLALVTRVIDGDTIEVTLNGKTYTVRYIGIDTPETVHPTLGEEPYGKEASIKNKELVEGEKVRLEKDVSETDQYGRLLRYVYVDDLFVNAELVRLGYAQVATYPPDVKYQSYFLQLQNEARTNGRGLWGLTSSSSTTAIPTPTQSPASTSTTARSSIPSPSGSLTLQIVSVTSPVNPGDNATLIAQTIPGANCEITVYYKSGPSSASGLGPKTADSSGRVSWTWKVGTNTSPGNWQIVVKASYGGNTISQNVRFTVQ